MTIRVIDGPCPVCGHPKEAIVTIEEPYWDIDEWKTRTRIYCSVCGYDESMKEKFPSHQE